MPMCAYSWLKKKVKIRFGGLGGASISPHFIQMMKMCCHGIRQRMTYVRPFGAEVYAEHKQWCDDYFYLKHRDEQRGVGGLFFDDLNQWDFETCFQYIQAVGNGYLEAILPIFQRNQDKPFSEAQRDFQIYRRGRYVEYNLVYDRGTLFGLQTGGRIESILVSLPNLAGWSYRPEWEADSAEKKLTDFYLKPQDWLKLLK